MSYKNAVAGLIIGAMPATGALAVEVTGGDLNLRYSAFTDETSFNAFSGDGALEIGFNRNFAAQVDLGFYSFGDVNETGYNATLHGIYHFNDNTSFGVFYGQDDLDGFDTDFYGLEAGYESSGFTIEGYLGAGKDGDSDVTLYGVQGAYAISDAVDITGALERLDGDDDAALGRYEIGLRYNATPSTAFSASIGTADVDDGSASASETFIAVAAEFTFGAQRGATFGRRGLLKLIPGL